MTRIIKQMRLILGVLVALSACGAPYEFKGGIVNPPTEVPNFTLTNYDGQPWTLSEQRGDVVMLFFGFTTCPDVCPTALADMAAMRRELGADADKVKVAMVTVDPERDTQERLQKYVTRFDPSFAGLRGSPEELQKVYKDYGVVAQRREMPDSGMKYTIDHTGITYVIDPAGKWQVAFTPDMTVEDMASDVRQLLRQGAS